MTHLPARYFEYLHVGYPAGMIIRKAYFQQVVHPVIIRRKNLRSNSYFFPIAQWINILGILPARSGIAFQR